MTFIAAEDEKLCLRRATISSRFNSGDSAQWGPSPGDQRLCPAIIFRTQAQERLRQRGQAHRYPKLTSPYGQHSGLELTL